MNSSTSITRPPKGATPPQEPPAPPDFSSEPRWVKPNMFEDILYQGDVPANTPVGLVANELRSHSYALSALAEVLRASSRHKDGGEVSEQEGLSASNFDGLMAAQQLLTASLSDLSTRLDAYLRGQDQ